MHKAMGRQLSYKPSLKPEQTWSMTVTSDQHFCRQRGTEIALEQVTPPAHPSGTRGYRSPGVTVKLSAQSKLLYRGSEATDHCWRKIISCTHSVLQQELLSLLHQTRGVDFLFATIIKTGPSAGLRSKVVLSSSVVCLVARRRSWTRASLQRFWQVCSPQSPEGLSQQS